MISVILVRYGEISLKSPPTLRRMIRHLIKNIKISLNRAEISFEKVIHINKRVIVYTDQILEGGKIIAQRVPGVVSTSPAYLSETSFNDISEMLHQVVDVSYFEQVSSFAIKVNRTGDHSFSSREMVLWMADQVTEIANKYEVDLKVDLEKPDLRVDLDIRGTNTYLFFDRYKGLGGLPMGTQEDAIAIIRGYYEDYVAASAVMKRGVIHKLIVFTEYPIYKQNKEINEEALFFLNQLQPRQPLIHFENESREGELEWGKYIYETVEKQLTKYGARGVSIYSSEDRKWLEAFPPGLSVYEPLFALNQDEIIHPFIFFEKKW